MNILLIWLGEVLLVYVVFLGDNNCMALWGPHLSRTGQYSHMLAVSCSTVYVCVCGMVCACVFDVMQPPFLSDKYFTPPVKLMPLIICMQSQYIDSIFSTNRYSNLVKEP